MQIPTGVQPVSEQSGALVAPADEIIRFEGVSKSFVGTLALNNVDFDLRRGECHILFGENGAGKSTLIQILAGVHRPTRGQIFHAGKPIEIQSVHHARSLGISAVFQEFSIAPALTVAENLFLGSEPRRGPLISHRKLRAEAQRLLDSFGFKIGLNTVSGRLSRAEMQMLEIARAFRTKPSVLILDEPTASLTDAETDRLFDLVARLKEEGVGIIYITHRMHEIQRIGDRVTVLRDGRLIDTLPMAEAGTAKLISLMTGRESGDLFPEITARPGQPRLVLKDLSTEDGHLRHVSLRLRAGEVVGVAGLVGSGKGDIGPACLGTSALSGGEVIVDGLDATGLSPRQTLDIGLCYVPSDRRNDGLFLEHDICTNISIASLQTKALRPRHLIRRSSERALAASLVEELEVRPARLDRAVGGLSGGNQQKVMIGRFLAREASVYIFDEPTVGVDVGARRAIYDQIRNLCDKGAAVLLISSDLPEILNMTHRAYVMHQGHIVGELDRAAYSETALLQLMFGQTGGARIAAPGLPLPENAASEAEHPETARHTAPCVLAGAPGGKDGD